MWDAMEVAPLWKQVGADLWDGMEALEVKQGYYFDNGLKAGLLELETPLLEMIALLLESKLCSIWTEG